MQNLKSFLHFESDEWGGMEFLQSPKIRLVCSDLSSMLNLTGYIQRTSEPHFILGQ